MLIKKNIKLIKILGGYSVFKKGIKCRDCFYSRFSVEVCSRLQIFKTITEITNIKELCKGIPDYVPAFGGIVLDDRVK